MWSDSESDMSRYLWIAALAVAVAVLVILGLARDMYNHDPADSSAGAESDVDDSSTQTHNGDQHGDSLEYEGSVTAVNPKWLSGTGNTLKFRICGQVFDDSDQPAIDVQLNAYLELTWGRRETLPIEIDGSEFVLSVPVATADWIRLHIVGTMRDGQLVVHRTIPARAVRQTAIDGLRLMLAAPERLVAVTVQDDGTPVADAHVSVATETGLTLTGKTDSHGSVVFSLMKGYRLRQVTAWTDDYRIGGQSFNVSSHPTALSDAQVVELHVCRPQKIRILDAADQLPLADLDFVLMVRSHDHQHLGKMPHSFLKTDDNGEAVFRWFPDWEQFGTQVGVFESDWFDAMNNTTDGDTIVIRLHRPRHRNRPQVVGRVTSSSGHVAGLRVNISSIPKAMKHHTFSTSVRSVFTDANGQFAASYTPGTTYCIDIDDDRLVSDTIDLIPVETSTEKINAPVIEVFRGSKVEISTTSGATERPISYQRVNLRVPHEYSWRENGATKHATLGCSWSVFTDAKGTATTFARAGKQVQGSVFLPGWQPRRSAEVSSVGVTRLKFHRPETPERKISGRLVLPAGAIADLRGAVVRIQSIGSETPEQHSVLATSDGTFEVELRASHIDVYASTRPPEWAAAAILDVSSSQSVSLKLEQTGTLHGQLLGMNDVPVVRHPVQASLGVSGAQRDRTPDDPFGQVSQAVTDAKGNYSLKGLPYHRLLTVSTPIVDSPGKGRHSVRVYLTPGESRPKSVVRLPALSQQPRPLSTRFSETLRDCRLGHFHGLVILYCPDSETKSFVHEVLLNDVKTKEALSFLPVTAEICDESPASEAADFVREMKWPFPENRHIVLCAIHPDGVLLGQINLDTSRPDSAGQAQTFLRQNAPQTRDARQAWDKAFVDARKSGRRVWARVCGRHCGPCFRLARWMDANTDVLEQDYVMMHVDAARDLHGTDIAKTIRGGKETGIPFYAIFDADRKLLIDSMSPIGNAGYPRTFEACQHLRAMLEQTRVHLSAQDVEALINKLDTDRAIGVP